MKNLCPLLFVVITNLRKIIPGNAINFVPLFSVANKTRVSTLRATKLLKEWCHFKIVSIFLGDLQFDYSSNSRGNDKRGGEIKITIFRGRKCKFCWNSRVTELRFFHLRNRGGQLSVTIFHLILFDGSEIQYIVVVPAEHDCESEL